MSNQISKRWIDTAKAYIRKGFQLLQPRAKRWIIFLRGYNSRTKWVFVSLVTAFIFLMGQGVWFRGHYYTGGFGDAFEINLDPFNNAGEIRVEDVNWLGVTITTSLTFILMYWVLFGFEREPK